LQYAEWELAGSWLGGQGLSGAHSSNILGGLQSMSEIPLAFFHDLQLISHEYSSYGANAVWGAACSFSVISGTDLH
jgi:hypothetical protein